MTTLPRAAALKIATGISLVVAVHEIFFHDLPGLIGGAEAFPLPYWIILGSFTSDILALAAAYGAWRGQKWGTILLICVNLFWLIQASGGLLIANGPFDLAFAGVLLVLHLITIVLCLWREPVVL